MIPCRATEIDGSASPHPPPHARDMYRFCTYGLIPVAWGGNHRKVGTAWDYATARIPVGRQPMLSPRISRIWR